MSHTHCVAWRRCFRRVLAQRCARAGRSAVRARPNNSSPLQVPGMIWLAGGTPAGSSFSFKNIRVTLKDDSVLELSPQEVCSLNPVFPPKARPGLDLTSALLLPGLRVPAVHDDRLRVQATRGVDHRAHATHARPAPPGGAPAHLWQHQRHRPLPTHPLATRRRGAERGVHLRKHSAGATHRTLAPTLRTLSPRLALSSRRCGHWA